MKKEEYAVLFHIDEVDDKLIYIPERLVKGAYNSRNKTFLAEDGTILKHIINSESDIGFAYRSDIDEDMASELLDYANSFNYEFSFQEFEGNLIPIITATENQELENVISEESNSEELNENYSFLYDRDILAFYLDSGFYNYADLVYRTSDNIYPEIEERLIKLGEPNIEELYQILTSKIKGQDEKIKEILGFIWKHYYDNENYHNILLTGNKGVGKSAILKLISEYINIPCCRLTITQYGINITDGIKELLKKANNDTEKAEKGIIIIDNSESLTTEGGKYLNMYNSVQQDVVTLINEGIFNISSDEQNPFYFSTKNLFVIMAGDFSKLKPYLDKKVGIAHYENEDIFKKVNDTNLENNFFSKFSKVIKLKDLTKEDYLTILKSSAGIIERTKELYKKNNVTIEVDDATLDYLAELASKMPYGVITINLLFEKAIASVTYDVASNSIRNSVIQISVNNDGLLEAKVISNGKRRVRKK